MRPAIRRSFVRRSFVRRSFVRRSFVRRSLVHLVAAAVALPGAAALADPLFSITILGGAGSSAAGINSAGTVAGNFTETDTTHAFVYGSSGFTDLGTLGGANSHANGINDSGQIVGGADTAGGQSHAFLYAGGSMSDLGTLGGNSDAYAINNSGAIVGEAYTAAPAPNYYPQAVSYAGGAVHTLGTLPGGEGSYAYAINNPGLIGGGAYAGPATIPEYPYYAVTYSGGAVQPLSALTDSAQSAIRGLNDLGQAVGGVQNASFAHASHAFLYDHGTAIDLGFLASTVDDATAYDINNLGQIVGTGAVDLTPESYGYHGFLYTGDGLVDLNTLIDPALGLVITDAVAINDASQIAATACRGGVSGDCYAVRLDLVPAVPEPASWAMLVSGLGLAGVAKRRRTTARHLAAPAA